MMISPKPTNAPLGYAPPDFSATDRFPSLLAAGSLATALLGFPLGAGTSILMSQYPRFFSSAFAERGGFMLFAVLEGIATAAGLMAALQARRSKKRSTFWLGVSGAILGGIGSVAVLILIVDRAIR